MKIAFLEDDVAFAQEVVEWLQQAGHDVVWFENGKDCQRELIEQRFELCLLDLLIPDIGALELMAGLKLKGILPPVIFLTARDGDDDIVKAFEAGADDYIVKPVSRAVLLARINALARRLVAPQETAQSQLYGCLLVDPVQRRFEVNGNVVNLTEKETDLALYLFANVGILLSRAHLMQVVWGSNPDIDTRTIDVHVSHLRSKLKLVPEHGWRLVSVYQQGYRLERFA